MNALARPTERGASALRARAIAKIAYERGAEVCRGPLFDAALEHMLNREAIRMAELTRQIAQLSGAILARARMNSASAVDACVVATALEFEPAVIATGDAADLRRLTAPYPRISLLTL